MSSAQHVLDTSAVLAMMLGEPGGALVRKHISEARISAVNLAELLSKLRDRRYDEPDIELARASFADRTVAFDARQAALAGSLRQETRAFGLSLGDRCCLALAMTLDATVLTADRAWERLNLGLDIEVIR